MEDDYDGWEGDQVGNVEVVLEGYPNETFHETHPYDGEPQAKVRVRDVVGGEADAAVSY